MDIGLQMCMQDSLRSVTEWQTENDIVIPVTVEEKETALPEEEPRVKKPAKILHKPVVKTHYGVPRLLSYPYAANLDSTCKSADAAEAVTDSLTADSVLTGGCAGVKIPGEEKGGIVLVNPVSEYISKNSPGHKMSAEDGMSWVYLVLALMFCVIGIKFKGNSRYVKALIVDLTDTRLRHNAFDDTVKETSLLFLLNVMWVACAGVLLWMLVKQTVPGGMTDSLSISVTRAEGIGLCTAVAGIYLLVMTVAYWVVGYVFSDQRQAQLWVKGASAAYGLETVALFPLALLSLTYPAWGPTLLLIAAAVFLFGKIVFLYKGFRIFFTQISSWLLFLYYLCSLEIVPLILAYVAAVAACTGSAL